LVSYDGRTLKISGVNFGPFTLEELSTEPKLLRTAINEVVIMDALQYHRCLSISNITDENTRNQEFLQMSKDYGMLHKVILAMQALAHDPGSKQLQDTLVRLLSETQSKVAARPRPSDLEIPELAYMTQDSSASKQEKELVPKSAFISLKTDKDSYTAGEDIIISGTVTNVQTGQHVLIRVMNPLGALARTDPVAVAADGSWTYTFPSGGPLMAASGDHRVIAGYRGISQQTTFRYDAGIVLNPWTINISNSPYVLRYQIVGGTLNSIVADIRDVALTITIRTHSAGLLRLELPRSVFDSKDENGRDIEFVVFIDGVNAFAHEPILNTNERVLEIPFEKEIEEITIVGTKIAGKRM
jgi:hypothetical protein